MATIAGSVMFLLFLVAVAATIAGVEILRDPDGNVVALVPATGLWLLALMSLSAVGVIAAILATVPRTATLPTRERPAAPGGAPGPGLSTS